jgi:hypothetical protein
LSAAWLVVALPSANKRIQVMTGTHFNMAWLLLAALFVPFMLIRINSRIPLYNYTESQVCRVAPCTSVWSSVWVVMLSPERVRT